jgi:serine/threonine-protein kinase
MNLFPEWETYRIVEKIGEGGMANVYKAFDPKLKRFVALKFLKIDSLEMKQRFSQEAQSQARLTHDNICQIYKVGEYGNTPYISMQYISGKPLLDSTRELNVELKARMMITIARAIHEAHRNGVIHRDIKPQNIFIEEGADGSKTPYIMDFGLAKVIESPSSTISGTIIGTPNYMSPEQVYGERDKIDRRSDVYCLGSTMYEVFSGKNCFDEESPFKVLRKLVNHDFPSPLKINPLIPGDIETIILKCMEKEPSRRYGSAKELADDLQRFLDGEPLRAKPASLSYRLIKKVKKHKATFISGGSFLIIAIFFLGMWIHSNWEKNKIAKISQMFIHEIEQTEKLQQLSNTIPLHDTRYITEQIKSKLVEIELKTKTIGRLARGPGYYALGTGYLFLNQNKKALKYLKMSWENGYRNKNASYSLGVVLGNIYESEREKLKTLRSKYQRKIFLNKIKKLYQKPALNYLKQSKGILGKSPQYIEGLISFYAKDYKKALQFAELAFKQHPWLYQAKVLVGRILHNQAEQRIKEGKIKEALKLLQNSKEVLTQAIRIGESDYKPYIYLSYVWLEIIDLYLYETGQDFYPVMQKCLDTLKKAEKINTDLGKICTIRAKLYATSGEYKIEKGQDPNSDFAKGIKSCNRSLQLQPEYSPTYRTLGNIYIYQSYYQLYRGQDPSIPLGKGLRILKKAINLDPDDASNYMSLGVIFAYQLQQQINTDQSPLESISNSIKTFKKVIELDPEYYDAYSNLGGIYNLKADYEEAKGKNPLESINLAIESHQKCIDLKPSVFSKGNLGIALSKLAEFQLITGTDPIPALYQTESIYREQVKVLKQGFRGYNGLASVYNLRGKWDFIRGRDPELLFNKSIENYSKSLQINSKYTYTSVALAEVNFDLAEFHMLEGRSPLKWINDGLRCLSDSEKINPETTETHLSHMRGILLKIRYLISINKSPDLLFKQYQSLSVKAEASQSFTFSFKSLEGEAALLQGMWKIKSSKTPKRYFKASESHLKDSLIHNSRSANTYLIYSKLLFNRAKWRSGRNQNAIEIINQGILMAEKSLEINPRNASAMLVKAELILLKTGIEPDSTKSKKYKSEGEFLKNRALKLNTYLKNSLTY